MLGNKMLKHKLVSATQIQQFFYLPQDPGFQCYNVILIYRSNFFFLIKPYCFITISLAITNNNTTTTIVFISLIAFAVLCGNTIYLCARSYVADHWLTNDFKNTLTLSQENSNVTYGLQLLVITIPKTPLNLHTQITISHLMNCFRNSLLFPSIY